ncbi:hypothetical protein WG904_12430 [Pedobacter sp. Du54]|uniref:hypothetical protein n=1 Tax=Pedobacter anseongensis TaxID=3133439 RepID=UPI0030A09799
MKINQLANNSMMLFILSCACLCYSCKGKSSLGNAKEGKPEVIGIGKILMLPDSMEVYRPFPNYLLDSGKINQSTLKIYTFINVSCSTCLEDIEKWSRLNSKLRKYNVPIVVICESKDKFEVFKYFCEQGTIKKFPYPFFLDLKNEYVKKNPFVFTHAGFKTLLTNQENKILLAGDPIHFESKEKEYLSVLSKYSGSLKK